MLISEGFGQVQTAHTIGDTIYRYRTVLNDDIQLFRAINLQYLVFPCVDRFRVASVGDELVDYALSKPGYKEYYKRDATVLKFAGGVYPDPFMASVLDKVTFEDPVAMVRSSRKDDFYERSSNDFKYHYMMEELNEDLRDMLDELRATELRVAGTLQTSQTYKRKDSFDNLREIIEGFVVETDMKYLIKRVEIKKAGLWQVIQRDRREELREYFDNVHLKYLSFFSYESLAEVARLDILPKAAFFFHSDSEMGRHLSCQYSGESIYVYPNPSFGDVKVKFNRSRLGSYEFRISNIIGKTLWSKDLELLRSDQEINLELPAFSKGVYLYQIKDPNGKLIQSRRLILVEP